MPDVTCSRARNGPTSERTSSPPGGSSSGVSSSSPKVRNDCARPCCCPRSSKRMPTTKGGATPRSERSRWPRNSETGRRRSGHRWSWSMSRGLVEPSHSFAMSIGEAGAVLDEARRIGDVAVADGALLLLARLLSSSARPLGRSSSSTSCSPIGWDVGERYERGRTPDHDGRVLRAAPGRGGAPGSRASRPAPRRELGNGGHHVPGRGWPVDHGRPFRGSRCRVRPRAAPVRRAREPFRGTLSGRSTGKRFGSGGGTQRRSACSGLDRDPRCDGRDRVQLDDCGLLAGTLCDLERFEEADAVASRSRELARRRLRVAGLLADGAGARCSRTWRVRRSDPTRRRGDRDHRPNRLSSSTRGRPRGSGRARGRGPRRRRARAFEESLERYERKGNVVAAARIRARLQA